MKSLFAISAIFLVSGCATSPTAPTAPTASTASTADVQPYPAWLEMKPGYAEICAKGGGCVPMTQGELQQMTLEIMNRTFQACRRLPST